MITGSNRIIIPPVQCCAIWSKSTTPKAVNPRPFNIYSSKRKRSCPTKKRKRANASQVERGDREGHHHVENSLLSEIEGSRGVRRSSRGLDASALELCWILHVVYSLFILYIIICWMVNLEDESSLMGTLIIALE